MSEDKKFQSVLDKAKELESYDFSNGSEFNIQEYYSALEKIAQKNDNFKNEEAESIVDSQAAQMIEPSFVEELKRKRKTVEDYIRMFNPNLPSTQKLEIQDVDKIYAISNYLLNAYIQYVNEAKFIINLTKEEYKFLNKVLLQEIPYNGDEVFNFAELYTNFWEGVQKMVEEDKSLESYTVTVEIKMLLILHHLIKNHTVKGKTLDFKFFQSILFKIAKVNKLFNAYNIIIERIKSDRELWGNGLDEIMKSKDPEYQKQMQEFTESQEKLAGGMKNVEVHPVTPEDLGEK